VPPNWFHCKAVQQIYFLNQGGLSSSLISNAD